MGTNWNQTLFPSLKRRGGCGINQKSRSHRSAADGVVSSAKSSGLKVPAELTTPPAPFLERVHFLMARSPLLFKEGNGFALTEDNFYEHS
jgi:hypothetical protein